MQKQAKSLYNLLKGQLFRKIMITTHKNADPDGLCSGYALMDAISSLFSIKSSLVFDNTNNISKQILSYFNISYQQDLNFEPDLIIILDANNLMQLGTVAEKININNTKFIIIDHHSPIEQFRRTITPILEIIDPTKIATCEIVYSILTSWNYQINETVASCLLAGILYDSKRFFHISKETFSIAADLSQKSIDFYTILELLSTKMDISERIARLKAAQRGVIHKINNWIIVVSKVSSYEASACRSLIDLGADVAIVLVERKNEVRVSIRTTIEFHKKTKIDVGKDLLEPLSELVNGVGGGHSTAGGLNGTKNGKLAIEKILEIIHEKLRKK